VKNRSDRGETELDDDEVQPSTPSTATEATATGMAPMTARRRMPPAAGEAPGSVIDDTRQV
jgi:hypothetical protein